MKVSGPLLVFAIAFTLALVLTASTPCCSIVAGQAASQVVSAL